MREILFRELGEGDTNVGGEFRYLDVVKWEAIVGLGQSGTDAKVRDLQRFAIRHHQQIFRLW
jgi:hypothetical protein